jgi:hypothetical protein
MKRKEFRFLISRRVPKCAWPTRAHRDVGITAEGALLHVAVADADPAHQRVQGPGIGDRFGGRAHVGLGDDLQQGRSGTVEVDSRAALEMLPQAFMQRLAGILLEVGAGQGNRLFAFADLNRQLAAQHHRQFVLADLITLGEIRVEVVLACKDRSGGNLRTDREAKADRADRRRPCSAPAGRQAGRCRRRSPGCWGRRQRQSNCPRKSWPG